MKSQNTSFILHNTSYTGEPSPHRITAHLPVKGRITSPLLFFFISPSEEIVSSVSVSPPLWDELYYKLCKQSVDMCCCLATLGGESNRTSVRPYDCVCVCVFARMCDFDAQNVTLRTLESAHVNLCDECVCVCVYVCDLCTLLDVCATEGMDITYVCLHVEIQVWLAEASVAHLLKTLLVCLSPNICR